MRRFHQAAGSGESYSPAEDLFNRRRRTAGLLLGPLAAVGMVLLPMPGVSDAAQHLSAILVLMIILWMTEAIPLAATALLGPTLVVVTGIAPARTAFAAFADPIIFLFIGSFILAEAMFVHRLGRRMAFSALSSPWIGSSAFRLVVVYACVSAGLSMWMSNTATTAMVFPLGMAVLAELGRGRNNDPAFQRFALAMMLVTSFAASIGGMATPVGTPPNIIGKGLLLRNADIDISFAGWMAFGLPLVALMMAAVVLWMLYPASKGVVLSAQATAGVRDQLKALGPMGAGERNVVLAFGLTVFLWTLPGLLTLTLGAQHGWTMRFSQIVPESVAAILGALLLFVLPVSWRARKFTLTWEEASHIDWGIILLFGGGLAMGGLADSTGLAEAFGRWVVSFVPGAGTIGLTLVFTAVAILMSEAASNTAAATIVVPTAIAVSIAAGVSPLEPALGATFGASMGFMMPISTPPNAIVYSSGYVPIGAMMRYGVVLDVIGYVVIVVGVLSFGWIVR
ncbi:MAG: DASS family sodium-coupled anion symporter [Acidobacteria bacterium]|nr:DASS family sodium-coupled anion symporter [Acidobacteriota bacterium]